MTSTNHIAISERFNKELDGILRFVDFLNSAIGLDRLTLHRVNSNLRTLGFDHVRLPAGGLNTPIHPADLPTMAPRIDLIEKLIPQVLKTYDEQDAHYQNVSTHDVSEDNPKEFEKWADYVTTIIPAAFTPDSRDKLRADLRNKMERDDALTWLDDDQFNLFVDDAVALAMKVMHDFRRKAAYELLEHIEHLKFLATFSNVDAEINAFRQSFILLMTAFDAAIFDLTRAALRTNFFPFISYFGKDARVGLADLGDFTTTDEFIDFVTEGQLKKRYLKDIIGLLTEVGVPLVDPKEHKLVELIELVLRRNLHVHNRGIVDQFYLDEGKNIDNLSRGQVAAIDEPYWHKALELTRDCVNGIAAWIQTGAPVPKRGK